MLKKSFSLLKFSKHLILGILFLSLFIPNSVYAITEDFTDWNSGTAEGWITWDRLPTYSNYNYQSTDYYVLIAKDLDLDSGDNFKAEWESYITKNVIFEIGNTSTGSMTATYGSSRGAVCQFNTDSNQISIIYDGVNVLQSGSILYDGYYNLSCEITDTHINASVLGLGSIQYDFPDVQPLADRFKSHKYARLFIRDSSDEYFDNFNLYRLVSSPFVTIDTSLINGTKNYNSENIEVWFNGTVSNTKDFFNVSLYDGVNIVASLNNTNITQNHLLNYTFGSFVGLKQFKLNVTNNNSSVETNIYFYNIDTDAPFITILNLTNQQNFTLGDTVNLSVIVNDSNLDGGYNILKYVESSTEILNISFNNITNTVFYFNSTYTPVITGNYTINWTYWDSHNPKLKPHEKYISFNKKVGNYTVKFYGGFINIEDKNIKNLDLISEDNHYTMDFEFKHKNLHQEMIITSDTPLKYRSDQGHKAHLVFRKLIKYLDLDSSLIQIQEVIYINDFSVKIRYINYDKKLKTHSIGDLNIKSIEYTFQVLPLPETQGLNTEILHNIDNTLNEIQNTFEGTSMILLFLGLIALAVFMAYSGNLLMGVLFGYLSEFIVANRIYFYRSVSTTGDTFLLMFWIVTFIIGLFWFQLSGRIYKYRQGV